MYANFTFCFTPWRLRSQTPGSVPVYKIPDPSPVNPSIVKTWVRLCWQCFKCLILAVVPHWNLLGSK